MDIVSETVPFGSPIRRMWDTHARRCPGSRPILVATMLLLLVAGSIQAATIIVDSTEDENGDSPANGTCTLREAVLAANNNLAVDGCIAGEATPTVDVIQVPPWVFALTIPETGDASGGSLDLLEDVVVEGSGSQKTTIDGLGAYIAGFNVDAAAVVEISDLCVRNAGAGGITNRGELTLSRSWITQNSYDGVKNWGIATIDSCRITRNSPSTGSGGGVYNNGGITILSSTIADNIGAGVTTVVGTLLIEDSTVSGNNRGGVVGFGGMQILNSTISSNHLVPGLVAAAVSVTLDGVLLLNNVTITGNSADYVSGIYVQPDAVVQLQNTVVGGNSLAPGCLIYGILATTGGNIESPGNTCGFNDPTDQANVAAEDLAIGPLAHHGGPTRTCGLEPGSVAIDGGVSVGPIHGCPGQDQRGQPRNDGLCDAGAVEVQSGENMEVVFVDGFASGDTSAWAEVVDG